MNPASFFRKIVDILSRWMGYLSTGIVVALMLLTVSDVAGRYFFRKPIIGTTELTELMVVVIIAAGLAWCTLSKRNISVEILVTKFPVMTRQIADIITMFISLGIIGVMTWRVFIAASTNSQISSLLKFPIYPFYWLFTAGCALMCLAIIVLLVDTITKVIKK